MPQHQPMTKASALSPSKAPVCPFCGHHLQWVILGALGFWAPCTCEGQQEATKIQQEREKAEKVAEVAKGKARRYRRAGIADRWQKELGWPYDPGALSICAAARSGRGTWLIGDVGLGKTRASMGAAMAFVDYSTLTVVDGKSWMHVPGAVVDCITDQDIIDASTSFGKKREFEGSIERWVRCDLLVIDDLGKAKPSSWNVSQIFAVIDGRYSAKKPLVVTSQYGPSDLIARLSQEGEAKTAKALVSRLCSMCDRKQLQGQDHRLEVC